MGSPTTHYDTLEIIETASPEVIRGAYRHLCQKWHPDKNPAQRAAAERRMQAITLAYDVLSDPDRRRRYDASLTAARGTRHEHPTGGGVVLHREHAKINVARNYLVYVDEILVGEIANGEQKHFAVPLGQHRLSLKIDWCSSNSVIFEARERSATFQCGCRVTGLQAHLALYYTTVARHKYLWLKETH